MSERLWAPWRMEYILSDKGGPCIFCHYPQRPDAHRSNLVLAVTPHAFAMLNRFPFAAAHVLVAPLAHCADPSVLSDAQWSGLCELVRGSIAAIRAAVSPDGVNVGMNLGAAAGAGIADHLHHHIVPRWESDTNFMPVVADLRVMPEHLDQTWERLAPHFASIR